MQDLGLFWQLTIKTIDDLRIVADENLTLEMYIMQLTHLKSVESAKELKIDMGSNNQDLMSTNYKKKDVTDADLIKADLNPSVKNQLKSTEQIRPKVKEPELTIKSSSKIKITSFLDLINLANRDKEVELKFDLERNVSLVSFDKGKIDISFNEKLNKNFIKVLTEKLFYWTGERWIISLSKKEGSKTIYEKKIQEKKENLDKEKNNTLTKELLSAFPDAHLVDVKEEDNDA